MTIYELLAIIATILIPLVGFLIYLRTFIKDTVKAELKGELDPIKERLSKVEEGNEWAKEILIKTVLPEILGKKGNPDGRREVLLKKLETQGFLHPTELKELKDILEKEAEEARRRKEREEFLTIIAVLSPLSTCLFCFE